MRRNYNHNSQNNTRRKRGHLTKIRRKHSHLTKIRRKRSHLTRKKIRRKHKTTKNTHFRRKQTVRGKRRYIKQVGGVIREIQVQDVGSSGPYSIGQLLDLDKTGCETGIIKKLEANKPGNGLAGIMTIDVDGCTQGDLEYLASPITQTWHKGTFYFNNNRFLSRDNHDLRWKVTGVVDIPDYGDVKNRFNVEHEKPNNAGARFANAAQLALRASNAAEKKRWMNALHSPPDFGPTAAAATLATYDDGGEHTSAQRLDPAQMRFAKGAGGGYNAAPLNASAAPTSGALDPAQVRFAKGAGGGYNAAPLNAAPLNASAAKAPGAMEKGTGGRIKGSARFPFVKRAGVSPRDRENE